MHDDRFAQVFAAVVRLGSIRKAAVTLGVDPSAVSRAISAAEIRYGVVLLERTSRGILLTEAGRVMRDHVWRQIEDGDRLRTQMKRLSAETDRQVRIRCGEGFLTDLIENGLPHIRTAAPGINLNVSLGTTQEICQSVAENSADIGIAYDIPADPNLRTLTHRPHPLTVIAPTSDRLVIDLKETMDLKAFIDVPMGLLPETYGVRKLLEISAERHGFHLKPFFTCSSISGLLHFVASGGGVTFLPSNAAAALVRQGSVRVATLSNPSLNFPNAALFVRARQRPVKASEIVAKALMISMKSFKD
ncbi:LysR family transcriptional regulator [Fulvimarina sp. MAC3]|uniref:LysR family transcriptional regulator n=1 Tax=Fulvimarina sp. MAC3 TaxID=3148887 RepID=UPI0031FD1ADC